MLPKVIQLVSFRVKFKPGSFNIKLERPWHENLHYFPVPSLSSLLLLAVSNIEVYFL